MKKSRVLVTGAGGYVGSQLVPVLLQNHFEVIAFDTFWYGNFLPPPNPSLICVVGDLRFFQFEPLLEGVDFVIHLACISNDPSFELNPEFSRQINVGGSQRLIDACLKSSIRRFIFASSSSVYGIKNEEKVHEDLSLEPLTLYSRNKVEIENYLKYRVGPCFDYVILRPATLMGSSPRLRLDVVTHILSAQAFFEKRIRIFGGQQHRPQLHIDDMVQAYLLCLQDQRAFHGAIYNVGDRNYTVSEIAECAAKLSLFPVDFSYESSSDSRSYRISSEKFFEERRFVPKKNLGDGIREMMQFFERNSDLVWTDEQFHNVKRLKKFLTTKKNHEVCVG